MARNRFDLKIESNVVQARGDLKKKKKKIYKMWGIFLQKKWVEMITRMKIVDTGRFRNGVTFTSDSEELILGNPVSYAAFLEIGTSKTKARPSLKNTVTDKNNKETLKKIAKDVLEE